MSRVMPIVLVGLTVTSFGCKAKILPFRSDILANGNSSQPRFFDSNDPIEFSLTAPITTLRQPPQIGGTESSEFAVEGTIRLMDQADNPITLPVSVRIRGNSSRDECTIPKLKVKFTTDAYKQTVFKGAKSFKIGSHCADGEGVTQLGRLIGEASPWREASAYQRNSSPMVSLRANLG